MDEGKKGVYRFYFESPVWLHGWYIDVSCKENEIIGVKESMAYKIPLLTSMNYRCSKVEYRHGGELTKEDQDTLKKYER